MDKRVARLVAQQTAQLLIKQDEDRRLNKQADPVGNTTAKQELTAEQRAHKRHSWC